MLDNSICKLRSTLLHFHSLRSAPPQYKLWRFACTSQADVQSSSAQQQVAWSGLPVWRASGVDERRNWGLKGPQPAGGRSMSELPTPGDHPASLASCGRHVLLTADPFQKVALTHAAWKAYTAGAISVGAASAPDKPARPASPQLVPARQVPTAKQTTLPLNVYMLHTLAHIELNAIDLAWDTAVRFSPLRLPEQFYADFARVADDESRHLSWCLQRLAELGHAYGCMPAHDLLWQGCQLSAGDVRARLAVVPMSQEARGLDAGQRLADRLVGFGDNRSAAIVARISEEERAHVAVGVAWFSAVCAAEGADPGVTFASLVKRHTPDLLGGPFNHAARQEVGLRREWYDEAAWPESLRAAVVTAGARGEGRAEGGGVQEGEGGGGALAVEELRRRLWAIVAAEVQACR